MDLYQCSQLLCPISRQRTGNKRMIKKARYDWWNADSPQGEHTHLSTGCRQDKIVTTMSWLSEVLVSDPGTMGLPAFLVRKAMQAAMKDSCRLDSEGVEILPTTEPGAAHAAVLGRHTGGLPDAL